MIGHGLLLAFLLRRMTFREIWPQPYCIMPLVEVVSLGIRGTLLVPFAKRKQYRPFDHIVKLDCDRSEMPTRRAVTPS